MSHTPTALAPDRTGGTSRTLGPALRLRSALAAAAAGGALGALARHAVATVSPHPAGAFPWATFLVNVTGCLLTGILTVLLSELTPARRLLRPFLTVGVLGGFTTYSTYALDTHQLLDAGQLPLAAVHLLSTVAAALCAVAVGTALAGRVVNRRGRPRPPESGGTG